MIIGVTRRDQVDVVAHVAGITATQARLALDAVGGLIRAGLLEEGRLAFADLGTFTVVQRRARNVNNPATGVVMELPASAAVKFKPSPSLREAVRDRHS